MARDFDPFKLSSPRIFLVRMLVFLVLCALVVRMAISTQIMRSLLDSVATRLDEARDLSRYMTSLLIFLGVLGTFWGLIETVGSVGKVIDGLKVGGDAG